MGDKIHLNGEGFEELRNELMRESVELTSSLSREIDPINDETKKDTQQEEYFRRRKFCLKDKNFT
jgi:hypothetical protein